MKLDKQTLAILKNYASINTNLLLLPGSVIKTRSVQNTIFSSVTVPEVFPNEFGIYDLNEFLGVLSLFNNPELDFNDKFVRIYEGSNSIKYFSADQSVLSVPKKDITFPDPEISFKITPDNLAQINRAASVMRVPDLSFVGESSTLKMMVSDKKNLTSNAFEVEVGPTEYNFNVKFRIEMLKFMSLDYSVDISSKKVARFTAKDNNLSYFIGVESDSVFS